MRSPRHYFQDIGLPHGCRAHQRRFHPNSVGAIFFSFISTEMNHRCSAAQKLDILISASCPSQLLLASRYTYGVLYESRMTTPRWSPRLGYLRNPEMTVMQIPDMGMCSAVPQATCVCIVRTSLKAEVSRSNKAYPAVYIRCNNLPLPLRATPASDAKFFHRCGPGYMREYSTRACKLSVGNRTGTSIPSTWSHPKR